MQKTNTDLVYVKWLSAIESISLRSSSGPLVNCQAQGVPLYYRHEEFGYMPNDSYLDAFAMPKACCRLLT